MKYIRAYESVNVPSAGRFGSITRDAVKESLAVLSLEDGSPFIKYWLDPNPASKNLGTGSGIVRWRSGGADTGVFATQVGSGVPSLVAEGGISLLRFATEARMMTEDPTQTTLNRNAWSFWMAAKLTNSNTNAALLMGVGSPVGAGLILPNVTVYESVTPGLQVFAVREGGSSTLRVNTQPPAAYRGQWVIYGVTFSTASGIALRRNGVEVARDAGDLRPLTDGRFSLFADRLGASPFLGDVGHIFTSDADGSAPEYALATQRIEDMLLSAYGVTRGS